MGCDIHVFIEKYNKESETWELKDDVGLDCQMGRNYDLFAILADVRNGFGFAGASTGAGFNPISEPKGLPYDVSDAVQKESDQWGYDGHSHSYLSLKELKEYDWDQETQKQGTINAQEFLVYKKEGAPTSYCTFVSGPNIVHLSEEEMENMIATGSIQSNCYTTVRWGATYRSAADGFCENDIPTLEELSEDGEGEDVRLVFFFDN